MKSAKWKNKSGKEISGYWSYNWPSDKFFISLNSVDKITGMRREFTIYGDKPEWGNWKLIE